MKDIPGYEGRYAVTSCGKVWSYKRNIFMAQRYDKDGYLRVSLVNDDGKLKTFFVHRLVALAYIPNPEGKGTVNHKDEVKTHNYVGNLEWMTSAENIAYGTGQARSRQKRLKPVYCVELDQVFESVRAAADATSAISTNISRCCLGKKGYKTAGGYHWRFYNEDQKGDAQND